MSKYKKYLATFADPVTRKPVEDKVFEADGMLGAMYYMNQYANQTKTYVLTFHECK